MRAFYENEIAKKQLNDLGLFDKARQYMKIKGAKVFISSDILSGCDEKGNPAGLGFCTVKTTVIAELQNK